MSTTTAAILLAWFAILMLTIGMTAIFIHVRLLESETGPSPLARQGLTGFRLPAGARLTALVAESDRRTTIGVFVSRSCASCHELLDQMRASAHGWSDAASLAIVSDAELPEHAPNGTLYIQAPEDFNALQIPATPWVIAANSEGTIVTSAPLGSLGELESIIETARLDQINKQKETQS